MSTRYASPPTDLNDVAVAAALGDRAAMSAVLVRIRPMVLSFCRSRMQGMRYPSLSAQQRTILHLRIIDGRTATDTADALGMTPGAVRVAQHRALARLREEFATNSRNTKSRNA